MDLVTGDVASVRPGRRWARLRCWARGGCTWDAARLPGGVVWLLCGRCLALSAVPADVGPLTAEPADGRSSMLLGPAGPARLAVALLAAGLGDDAGAWQAERDRALTRPGVAVDGLVRLAAVGLALAARSPAGSAGLLQRLATAAELDLAEQGPL